MPLPDAEKPAFFQLFLMQKKASFFMAASYYYADRSRAAYALGAMRAADENTAKSHEMDDLKRMLLHYYNEVMLDGKWCNILTPEDFPPPPLELYPARKPTLGEGKGGVAVVLPKEGNEIGLHFDADAHQMKWIDLLNCGSEDLPYTAEADAGIAVTPDAGTLTVQTRLMVTVSPALREGAVNLRIGGEEHVIPVQQYGGAAPIHMDADARENFQGFRLVKGVGRGAGNAMEALPDTTPAHPAALRFRFTLHTDCAPEAEIIRFLTLNSNGNIRLRVRVDDGEGQVLSSSTLDEYTGDWVDAAMHNGEKLHLMLPQLKAGRHTLTVEALDPYIPLCGVNLYTAPRQECLLGPGVLDGGVALPEYDAAREGAMFGLAPGDVPLPWDVYCGEHFWQEDMLYHRNERYRPLRRGEPKNWLNEAGRKDVIAHLGGVVQPVNGRLCWEAENALTQTEGASCTGAWTHRQAETNGRTGLAMWVESLDPAAPAPALT